jgi:hypothetical protein
MFANAIDDLESAMPAIVVGGAATASKTPRWRQYYFFARDGAAN